MDKETNLFAQGRHAGEERLRELGFQRSPSGAEWQRAQIVAGHSIDLRVVLPPQFPAALPAVFVDRSQLPTPCAHVEESGKVCIAPDAALLLDVSRPQDLIADAIAKATAVLVDGVARTNRRDLIVEYSAYWPGKSDILSMLEVAAGVSRVHGCFAKRDAQQRILCAGSDQALQLLLRQTRSQKGAKLSAVFVPLRHDALPPGFDAAWTTQEALSYVRTNVDAQTWNDLQSELHSLRLPLLVLLGGGMAEQAGGGLVAFEIAAAAGAARELATRGFRPGKVFADRESKFVATESVAFHRVARRDTTYMKQRSGIPQAFTSASVVVVGCGAVGSHVAHHLGALGVGELRLIDHDHMAAENVFRHVLSPEDIDEKKVTAMERLLQRKFQGLRVRAFAERVEDIAQRDSSLLTADVIVFATGDHGVEMAINRLLPARQPRIHVWVEPLGVGFHVLVSGLDSSACIECLYEPHDEFGLVNQYSLVEPGQNFTRSLAGCAGAFVPFSGIDADRAAVDAATAVGHVLLKRLSRGALQSHFESGDDLVSQGFRLSASLGTVRPKSSSLHDVPSKGHCRYCASQRA